MVSPRFGLFSLFDSEVRGPAEHRYFRAVTDLVQRAEQLGFRSFWAGEEHFYCSGMCPSPQMVLASLAGRTSKMEFGSAVNVLPINHPLRLAEEFALLDVLSGGRCRLGVGRGARKEHFRGYGVDSRESRARYHEAIAMIRALWTRRKATFEGNYWRTCDIQIAPRPVRQPHPPIHRASVREESFREAGQDGDGLLLAPWITADLPEMARRLGIYREALRTSGHRGHTPVVMFFLFVDVDEASAVRRARSVTKGYIRTIAPHVAPEMSAAARPKRSRRNLISRLSSLSDNIKEVGVVGDPAQCRAKIREIHDTLGDIETVFYLLLGQESRRTIERQLDVFSHEIMGAFTSVGVK